MTNTIGKITLVSLLTAAFLGMPLRLEAQTTNTNKPGAVASSKSKILPYHGKLGAIDNNAKTITLDETTKRTFHITSKTKILKNGKPAVLADGVVGEAVRGAYIKDADGQLNAQTINFGAPTLPAPKPETGANTNKDSSTGSN